MPSEERMRVLLALAGSDQAQVARRAGISRSTLSRALRGERRLSQATQRRVVEAVVAELMADAA